MLHVIIDFFTLPFQYDFMRNAFWAGSMAAIVASLVGFFVVVRQIGFAAHALGHISFAGACGAILLGWLPIIGQLVVTLGAGIIMGSMGRRLNEKDTIIGVTLALALGVGVLLLHFFRSYSGQANSILFGDLLGVSTSALRWMASLMLLAILGLGLLARRLWFASLVPTLAQAKSISLTWISLLFFSIMALAITLASQVVGILLVFTLIVGPPAIALQWSKNFWSAMGVCCATGVLIVWLAVYLSYYTDWPVSFWISTAVFVLYVIGVLLRGQVVSEA